MKIERPFNRSELRRKSGIQLEGRFWLQDWCSSRGGARKQLLAEDLEGLEACGQSGIGCFNPGICGIEEHLWIYLRQIENNLILHLLLSFLSFVLIFYLLSFIFHLLIWGDPNVRTRS